MLVLLALPVFASVALVHRYLRLYAPSNVLVRRVRSSRPSFSTTVGLLTLAGSALAVMHIMANAVASGAPGWLNIVVLVLAWDAIKLGFLGISVGLRALAARGGHAMRRLFVVQTDR